MQRGSYMSSQDSKAESRAQGLMRPDDAQRDETQEKRNTDHSQRNGKVTPTH